MKSNSKILKVIAYIKYKYMYLSATLDLSYPTPFSCP